MKEIPLPRFFEGWSYLVQPARNPAGLKDFVRMHQGIGIASVMQLESCQEPEAPDLEYWRVALERAAVGDKGPIETCKRHSRSVTRV